MLLIDTHRVTTLLVDSTCRLQTNQFTQTVPLRGLVSLPRQLCDPDLIHRALRGSCLIVERAPSIPTLTTDTQVTLSLSAYLLVHQLSFRPTAPARPLLKIKPKIDHSC